MARKRTAKREPTATVDLKVRMKEPLRQQIEHAAASAGVSLNAEAIERLEQSFRTEGLLPQVLDLAYGPQTSGLLMLLGNCIKGVALAARTPDRTRLRPGEDWIEDPYEFRHVELAIRMILRALRPKGAVSELPNFFGAAAENLPAERQRFLREERTLGLMIAAGNLREVVHGKRPAPYKTREMVSVRERLSPTLKKMKGLKEWLVI